VKGQRLIIQEVITYGIRNKAGRVASGLW